MKNYIKIFSLGLLFSAWVLPFTGFSQNETPSQVNAEPAPEFDQLIPQLFAFDKEHGVFAAISAIDNTIDIIKHTENSLTITKKVLVDQFERRHDEHHIYRPQGVAMYENCIVYLASHRDSCYFAVLDLEGNLIKKYNFKGNAFAFSYSPSKQELYIAGQNDLGYDIIVIETSNGLANITPENFAALHYQKPRKGDEIRLKDPIGVGMAVTAMSVVFLSLLILTSFFSGYGKFLVSIQNFKTSLFNKKKTETTGVESLTVKPGNVSGEEYAAIAAAVYLYLNEMHDEESGTLTIKKVSRSWSPWSAKYYGMNQYFNKR